MSAAGDHRVQDHPVAVVEAEIDVFADAAQGGYDVAFDGFDGRQHAAQKKGLATRAQTSVYLRMRLSSAERGGNIGQPWHRSSITPEGGRVIFSLPLKP